MDDDADCVEHVWTLDEAHLTLRGADVVSVCQRPGCGAVRYEPGQTGGRPPLQGG